MPEYAGTLGYSRLLESDEIHALLTFRTSIRVGDGATFIVVGAIVVIASCKSYTEALRSGVSMTRYSLASHVTSRDISQEVRRGNKSRLSQIKTSRHSRVVRD